MFGRLLVGFVWLNLYITVSWLVDFYVVRVAQYLDFCVMVGRLLDHDTENERLNHTNPTKSLPTMTQKAKD
jgi:hypothetical protein